MLVTAIFVPIANANNVSLNYSDITSLTNIVLDGGVAPSITIGDTLTEKLTTAAGLSFSLNGEYSLFLWNYTQGGNHGTTNDTSWQFLLNGQQVEAGSSGSGNCYGACFALAMLNGNYTGIFNEIDIQVSNIKQTDPISDPFAQYSTKNSFEYGGAYGGLQITAVPVPATIGLFGSALAGFIGLNRRKQQSA